MERTTQAFETKDHGYGYMVMVIENHLHPWSSPPRR
jgi:hypothetical protein